MEITEADYPFAVTLRFKTKESRNHFMGGLSDAWGENECNLEWPSENWTEAENRSGKAFEECEVFGVTVFDMDE
jgi:hypothetical protein